MKIAIFGSEYQKKDQIEKLFNILIEEKSDIYIQNTFYKYLNESFNIYYNNINIIESEDFDADLVISVGGDGTFLRTASIIGKKDIPILGINAGRLGFLAEVGYKDMEITLSEIFSKEYKIEERTRLRLSTENKSFNGFNHALNEVAILKQDTASMIKIHAFINEEYLTSYEADGLIIATPTGSTAYSLSVGGPLVAPSSSNFIIAAAAPHRLSDRPLVVEDSCTIKLEVESRSGSFLVSLDGRSDIFTSKTTLTIKKSKYNLKLVKRLGNTFYNTLKDKLMWGKDPRE